MAALVTCEDCGKEVSPRAAACPGCGAPAHSGGVCVVVAPFGCGPGPAAAGPRCPLCGKKAEVKRREDAALAWRLLMLPCLLFAAIGWWWLAAGADPEPVQRGQGATEASVTAWVLTSVATLLVLVALVMASRMGDRHIYCKGCKHWQRP
ncbi:MAG: hypothetical protein R3F43_24245 [bacterium]